MIEIDFSWRGKNCFSHTKHRYLDAVLVPISQGTEVTIVTEYVILNYNYTTLSINAGNVNVTLWFLPCLSKSEMIDFMWLSLIVFKASGLSTKTQCNTSNIPKNKSNKLEGNALKQCLHSKNHLILVPIWAKQFCKNLPEEASSLSSLLTSQSKEPEKWAQLIRLPLIWAAAGKIGHLLIKAKPEL